MPEKNAPLTVEEITEAADIFFPLYEIVTSRMPDASVEDALKIMENLASLAQKERAKKREKEVKEKFGFNKQTEDTEDA
tara:strand:+ start:14983 stop:15219 length:237 start_codon:yes stop_codon:yes gene_type:complete